MIFVSTCAKDKQGRLLGPSLSRPLRLHVRFLCAPAAAVLLHQCIHLNTSLLHRATAISLFAKKKTVKSRSAAAARSGVSAGSKLRKIFKNNNLKSSFVNANDVHVVQFGDYKAARPAMTTTSSSTQNHGEGAAATRDYNPAGHVIEGGGAAGGNPLLHSSAELSDGPANLADLTIRTYWSAQAPSYNSGCAVYSLERLPTDPALPTPSPFDELIGSRLVAENQHLLTTPDLPPPMFCAPEGASTALAGNPSGAVEKFQNTCVWCYKSDPSLDSRIGAWYNSITGTRNIEHSDYDYPHWWIGPGVANLAFPGYTEVLETGICINYEEMVKRHNGNPQAAWAAFCPYQAEGWDNPLKYYGHHCEPGQDCMGGYSAAWLKSTSTTTTTTAAATVSSTSFPTPTSTAGPSTQSQQQGGTGTSTPEPSSTEQQPQSGSSSGGDKNNTTSGGAGTGAEEEGGSTITVVLIAVGIIATGGIVMLCKVFVCTDERGKKRHTTKLTNDSDEENDYSEDHKKKVRGTGYGLPSSVPTLQMPSDLMPKVAAPRKERKPSPGGGAGTSTKAAGGKKGDTKKRKSQGGASDDEEDDYNMEEAIKTHGQHHHHKVIGGDKDRTSKERKSTSNRKSSRKSEESDGSAKGGGLHLHPKKGGTADGRTSARKSKLDEQDGTTPSGRKSTQMGKLVHHHVHTAKSIFALKNTKKTSREGSTRGNSTEEDD
ncbi:unnamed protein product [Amoebophrya sp. A120]|nr:unnamed protein product [Amoebophrya sp. A120]|eukprot:GSA120T00019829001.1